MPVISPFLAGENHLIEGGVVAEYPKPMPMPPTRPKVISIGTQAWTKEDNTMPRPNIKPPSIAT